MPETLGTAAGALGPTGPTGPGGLRSQITGGTGGPPKKPPRRRSSRLDIQHGRASMKGYVVASIELWGLGGLGLVASLAFSLGASCLTFWVDTAEALDLSPGVDPATAAYWAAAGHFAKYSGMGLLAVGVLLVLGGSFYIVHILRRTKFDGDD